MATLKDKIVRAHGGNNGRWADVGEVLACATMGGLDFASRFQPKPLRAVEVAASTDESKITITPFLNLDTVGIFQPDRVVITDDEGHCLAERPNPAEIFRSWRHRLVWDELDVLYYAGILLWQTLNLPFLIMRPGLELKELPAWDVGEERWKRLAVTYPDDVPSIAAEQTLFADPTGLIRRVDYAPSAYSAWFGVSQLWEGHQSFDGLVYPTRQSIHPRLLSGQLWRLSTLVWLELEDITPVSRAGSAARRAR